MTAVIYARYSSDNQREESIEGQLHVCEDYAKNNDIILLDTYIDRAMTGTNDNRPAFQQMLKDSKKREWDYVLVYKFDRFSRNKFESTIHKKTLKDNGVKVLSAMENIPDTKWPFLMYDLLFRMNNTKKIAMAYGLDKLSDDKIEEYKKEYDDILELAKEENKSIKSSFYKSKKAKPLLNRLIKYKQSHLYFIEDFNVPFDNNLSEQDLRIFKNKTKISGGFRSMETAQNFANALSIIKTSIKRNINPFDSIKSIFNNKVLFAQ